MKAFTCVQCNGKDECSDVNNDVTCPSPSALCYMIRTTDNVVVEAGCASPAQELLYDRGVDRIQYHSQVETCENPSCNSVGSEQIEQVDDYECQPPTDTEPTEPNAETTTEKPKEDDATF